MNTRFWHDPDGASSTAVQWRSDTEPQVWLHTNLGWTPVGNTPNGEAAAQVFAEKIAVNYSLAEANESLAHYMAGF